MCSISSRWQLPHKLQSRRRSRILRAALQVPPAIVTPGGAAVADRPAPAASPPPSAVANNQSLRSTWQHRGWVTAGCAAVAVAAVKSAAAAQESGLLAEPLIAAAAGYLLADLGSGVYHWGIDNYGGAATPLTVAVALLPFDLFPGNAAVHAFAAVFAGCIMFSQQFHAWAHGTKSRLPAAVVALQDAGVLISRHQHAAHHRAPYNGNYCIVSGVWNEFLDGYKVFEAMEMVIFFKSGVRPRSWSEPESAWKEEDDERSP
ncbi:unnamed protein product [Spirodela intermedia]|uniref:Lipid desaturase domain-containing protein n=1 Tax=Spirodela intermedia TaxID=51605 RepID=A0A7I8JP76_SPIIN|nr:unnamed protein product [Spirodela intermedia]CAA6671959.1 unnamed protein product [Spirodela intermedia]